MWFKARHPPFAHAMSVSSISPRREAKIALIGNSSPISAASQTWSSVSWLIDAAV